MNSQLSADGAIHNRDAANLRRVDFVVSEAKFPDAFTGVSQGSTAKTILLVEDEAFVRRAIAEVLGSAGYGLMIAGSAAEAFAVCHKRFGSIDLLLADVVMPGMSGRELAAEFETRYPSAQVLLMSGYPEQLALCELSTSEKKYLAKPFSIGALLQRVREALNMKLFELEL
jgi:two-component system cell cycle sensor histidine kinase/response regulator CckA